VANNNAVSSRFRHGRKKNITFQTKQKGGEKHDAEKASKAERRELYDFQCAATGIDITLGGSEQE